MADLRTEFIGLTLPNPILAAASASTNDLGRLRQLEEAGIGGVITKLVSPRRGDPFRSVVQEAAWFAYGDRRLTLEEGSSLVAAAKTSANQNFLDLIAPAPDGGLVGVEHHDNQRYGGVTDPYLVVLDQNLGARSSLRLAGTYSFVTGLAAGGGVIAVVGMGPANEIVPGASAASVPAGLFLARYRL